MKLSRKRPSKRRVLRKLDRSAAAQIAAEASIPKVRTEERLACDVVRRRLTS